MKTDGQDEQFARLLKKQKDREALTQPAPGALEQPQHQGATTPQLPEFQGVTNQGVNIMGRFNQTSAALDVAAVTQVPPHQLAAIVRNQALSLNGAAEVLKALTSAVQDPGMKQRVALLATTAESFAQDEDDRRRERGEQTRIMQAELRQERFYADMERRYG